MNKPCDKIQKLGKGIANPSRYRIVELLIGGDKSVGEIVTKMKLTQPAVSQHLRTLKLCGLVKSSKNGQEVHYSLNSKYMIDIIRHLSSNVSKCRNKA